MQITSINHKQPYPTATARGRSGRLHARPLVAAAAVILAAIALYAATRRGHLLLMLPVRGPA